ncbi:MAG: putative toxin-antitoxin system toxin component, PIN family [bacterium]|nr:putative toxin-antitoxin system toxin component, PIN family [bacterium]
MIAVVLDTNVAVAGLLWTGPALCLLRHAQTGHCRILASQPMVDELAAVLQRSKFLERLRALRVTPEIPLTFYRNLVWFCAVAPLAGERCCDTSDQMFVDLAVAEAAHLLVSGDTHVLRMRRVGGIPVVRVTEALAVLAQLVAPPRG